MAKKKGEEIGLWISRIREQKESGQSIAEYCRRHELSRYQFTYWKRKVGAEKQTEAILPEPRLSGFIEMGPARVNTASCLGNDDHVEIRIGAFSIRFTLKTERDLFKTAAAILAEITK